MMIFELIPHSEFTAAVDGGYVRVQTHPDYPNLSIANYTEKAQFEKVWNKATLNARGLVFDNETWEVLARPFPKFFNYAEHDPRQFNLDAEVYVTDKMDGSLGILFFHDGQPHIATRGSFASDQARHATALFRERYADFVPGEGYTALFEIVYPQNRIVLDYQGVDDLFLLGSVGINTGTPFGPKYIATSGWKGPRTATLKYKTLREALAAPPRPNAEGIVVTFVDSKKMVKIKQEDYVALHKVITGLNARTVWEALGEGKSIAEICDPLPDEFHDWVRDIAYWLIGEQDLMVAHVKQVHEHILDVLNVPVGGVVERKAYAALATTPDRKEISGLLFMLLDGKQIGSTVWKTLRPRADETPNSSLAMSAA